MLVQSEFLGNMAHTMDQKGRVTIPAVYREALGPSFYVGMNTAFSAIALYTREKWESMRAWLDAFPASDARATNYARLIKANIFSGETDSQGRVLIPTTLRTLAGINKAIRFVGMGQYLEVWDEERYASEQEKALSSIADLLSYVNDKYSQA